MLIDALTTKENIERAFDNALAERLRSEHVCFPSEIAIARESKPEIIASIHKILMHPECYEPEFGFYYTMPKTELVNRHLVYLPFKELVIHYCFIQVLAERLDLQLQTTCFANRLELDKKALRLSEEFAQKSWPAYCDWQKLNGSKYSAMLKTDLSSFFDNVDMTLLIEKIAHKLGTDASNPFFKMFKKMLATPSYLYSHKSLLQKHKGIATGPSCMGVLANYYLMDIDNLMCNISGVEYGRYVDDIKLFSDDKDALQQAFSALQEALYTLGLNINGSKTKLLNSRIRL
ncbi:RNA-directed DNA polymerase [Vibrio ishigakensis]|uniref:RNA-directed DNA polymerase n=1 Tax=Vibrio ishigakensis TaxID=1481914 RepID=A0A0B8Q290_9VIBR|nr:RNA-directed DNA polymerase [Vibrio ishigakensis]